MTRSIQSILAGARLENEFNGLPCGEYIYSDPMKIENRYESEADDIRDQYGSKKNWDAWCKYHVEVRETKKWVFHRDTAQITGHSLKESPEDVLPLLDNSIYEVMTKDEFFRRIDDAKSK